MKHLLLIVALLFAGCDIAVDLGTVAHHGEVPTVNLPISLRQQNWLSPGRSGSCTHAVLVSAFRWCNQPVIAAWWRNHQSGGETPDTLAAKLDQANIRYVMTVGQNDRDFVRWSVATRRGAMVTILGGRHAVLICDMDDEFTYLLNNNQTNEYLVVPTDAFWAEWENSGSWSLAIVYSPIPGLP